MNVKKSQIAIVIAATLLTACSGGKGGFGLDNTQEQIPRYDPKKTKLIEFGDDVTEAKPYEQLPEFLQPTLGSEIAIPRRIIGPKAEERVELSPDNIKRLGGSLDEIPHAKEIEDHSAVKKSGEKFSLVYSHDNKSPQRTRNMDYVRSGFVFALGGFSTKKNEKQENVYRSGKIGYVFYKGINPSKALPVDKIVKYEGTWDFTTDAVNKRRAQGFEESYIGDRYGAISYDEPINNDKYGAVGHSSEFVVNFGKKELTGQLYRNHPIRKENTQEKTKRYDINAKLFGNRFRGSAKATDPKDRYFGKDANNSLEGGFYGPNAEELAGKFLSNDKSLFGVFAAKQKGQKAETETKFDARQIDLKDFKQSEMDSFGQANLLVIDGHIIPLLKQNFDHQLANKSVKVTACCENLADVKFGTFDVAGEGPKLYLTGERTAVDAIPKSGVFAYKGSWQGQISSQDGTKWQTPENSAAYLQVDFDNKRVNGGFGSGPTSGTVLSLQEGVIDKNGFSGVVKTLKDGFSANGKTFHVDGKVSGGFYGKTASEIGGSLLSTEQSQDKAAGVFGAKRQVEKK
ncbi:transferrin-binding protein-like solute binding protein [Actinobacillus pleuropneumoniae]|uniref:Transferrin-binding protein B n=1 Tax=Actinobacillus pleuropneumoniae TaxID=715 RepID=A0ABM6X1F1_ACTPL|nr:transferrin-binding protein-like solute binding protein [Actinobacillus pleuropneumoniae]ASU16169.1 Transferrin-binding protein 2 [Actinobacillus pleuropneumoniae]AWG94658.1 transferrin-binding protein-like solute binding protein [Actinobacillus pleuropneumoniae serovar 1 str. 4074]AXA20731.1 transferrin-binding protein-like solute binding protein [Actinobacillus pleuropneumoniae]MCL7726216.1 transferrin-binding protein-like solute binding protein [Actinobacillus pleuropneumoniae]MCL7738962